TWFDAYEKNKPVSLASLIDTPTRVKQSLGGRGKLDIIYSHLGLINVDLDLATKLGGASLSEAKRRFLHVHRRLADGIASGVDPLAYDLILIDCPPNFNIVTKTALIASDYLLVPARPDHLSTLGIDYLIRSVDQLVKDYNEYAAVQDDDPVEQIEPRMLGVVFTMIQEYGNEPMSAHRQYIARMLKLPGAKVFDSYVKRNDTIFAGAPQMGVPVVLHAYNSGSHQSVVTSIENVADEFAVSAGI
ncbi:ParA family protein, partial [Granulicella arctica]|uniref:ParA family protein n=1 Tax=Granulicella arctica TaxID=940613 RepID=UPI0021DFCF9B